MSETQGSDRLVRSRESVADVALLCLSHSEGTHTGILHRIKDEANKTSEVYILDLMWHLRLRSDQAKQDYLCVVPDLDDDEINDVTGMCRRIHSLSRTDPSSTLVPYAFHADQSTFYELETGKLVLGNGAGLTCSTFVIKVFEAAYVQLIDLTDWPTRPDDETRHKQLLKHMEDGIEGFSKPASAEHIAAVSKEVSCVRVRPEELTGVALYDRPDRRGFRFCRAELASQLVLEELRV